MQRLTPQHATAMLVAAAVVLLALSNGGFDPTGFGAAALIAWSLILVALAVGVVPRAEPPKPAVAAGLCLAGFAALTALSMLWGSDNGDAYQDVVRTLLYLGIFVLVVVAATRGDAVTWLAGLAIGLVAVAAIALGGRFEPSLFGNPDVQIVERLPAALGRLTYPDRLLERPRCGDGHGADAPCLARRALTNSDGPLRRDRRNSGGPARAVDDRLPRRPHRRGAWDRRDPRLRPRPHGPARRSRARRRRRRDRDRRRRGLRRIALGSDRGRDDLAGRLDAPDPAGA